jgi:hypothetical protein
MKEIINRIFTHWKTSLGALIICVVTVMLYEQKITAEDWMLVVGGLFTLGLLHAKDYDKTDK